MLPLVSSVSPVRTTTVLARSFKRLLIVERGGLLLIDKLGGINAERLAQLKDRRKPRFNLVAFDSDELPRRYPGGLGKLLRVHECPALFLLPAPPNPKNRQYRHTVPYLVTFT